MATMFNPVKLTHKPVELVYDMDTEPATKANPHGSRACGVTEANIPDGTPNFYQTFKITLYLKHCRQSYIESALYQIVPLETFVFSILVHEVAHVIADSFSVDPYAGAVKNDIYDFLDNILEDQRCEYVMMRKYPRYASYLQLSLSTLRWRMGASVSPQSGIAQDVNSIFFLARFGVIVDGSDPALMNIAFPLVVSSTRGDRANCLTAVRAIYAYLLFKYPQDPDFAQAMGAGVFQTPMTQGDINTALQSGQIIANSNKDVLSDLQDVVDGQKDPDIIAGHGGPPPSQEERDDSYYDAVLAGHGMGIQELRQVLIRTKMKTERFKSRSGDLNMSRQNDAYVNAMLGYDGMDYHIFKRMIPDIKVCVMRDISFSTDDFKEQYAALCVMLLAALDGERGVQYAHIDFNSWAEEIIPMGGTVRKNRIYPVAGGGTDLMPPLDIAFGGGLNRETGEAWPGYDWRAREKYLFIVGDGDIYDWYDSKPRIEKLMLEVGIVPMLFNVDPGAKDAGVASDVPWAIACPLERVPEIVMARITGVMYAR